MIRAPREYLFSKIFQFLTFYLVKSSPRDLQNFIQRRRFFYASMVIIQLNYEKIKNNECDLLYDFSIIYIIF